MNPAAAPNLTRALGVRSVVLLGLAYRAPVIVLGNFGVLAQRANGVGRHLILERGREQVHRLLKLTGHRRREERLQRLAPAAVWAGAR